VILKFDYLKYLLQAFSLEKDNKLSDLVDKTLEKANNLEQHQMQSVTKVALLCLQPNPESRPSMSNVLEMLLAEKIPSVPQTGETVVPIGIEIGSTIYMIPRGTTPEELECAFSVIGKMLMRRI
jgi:hypothetical protein